MLQIAREGWRQPVVVELLKTGLSGLDAEEADFLENFVLEHGIDKMAWISDEPWELTQSHAAEDEAPEDECQANARAEALRQRLVGPIRGCVANLHEPRPMREQVRALYDLLCCKEHNLREILAKWSKREHDAGNPERAQEHQQAWKQVMELLDDAVRLVGNVEATGDHFVQTIEAGLEDLGPSPDAADARPGNGGTNRSQPQPGVQESNSPGVERGRVPDALRRRPNLLRCRA